MPEATLDATQALLSIDSAEGENATNVARQNFLALPTHAGVSAIASRAGVSPSQTKRVVKLLLESPDPAAVRICSM